MKLKRKLKAYTLIETMLYVSMVGVFSLVVVSFWSSLTELSNRGKAMTNVTNESSFVMDQITQLIRNANAVNAPAAGTSSTSINLSMADATKNPTTISFSGGQIIVQEGSNPPVNLVSNRVILSGVNFSNISYAFVPATIKIQFQIANNNTSGRHESNYSTTLYDTASLRK